MPTHEIPTQRLLGIQLARGIAALLVVIYHAENMISLPQYTGHVGIAGLFEFGHAGVDFFFVLSGFIIFYAHGKELGKSDRLLRYIWRRVTRIYPSYWLVTAIVVVLMLAKHDSTLTPEYLTKSLLLLPQSQDPVLGVAWTLEYEMMFYSVFAIAILNVRLGAIATFVWLVTIVSGLFVRFQIPFIHVAASTINIEFAIGILAAYMVQRRRFQWPLFLLFIGAVVFILTGIAENSHALAREGASEVILFGASSGLMIAGLATAERQGIIRVGRIGEFFGGTSYLLYLVHTTLVGLTFRALMETNSIKQWPDWVSIALATVMSILAAACLYQFCERPLIKSLHDFGQKRFFGGRKQFGLSS